MPRRPQKPSPKTWSRSDQHSAARVAGRPANRSPRGKPRELHHPQKAYEARQALRYGERPEVSPTPRKRPVDEPRSSEEGSSGRRRPQVSGANPLAPPTWRSTRRLTTRPSRPTAQAPPGLEHNPRSNGRAPLWAAEHQPPTAQRQAGDERPGTAAAREPHRLDPTPTTAKTRNRVDRGRNFSLVEIFRPANPVQLDLCTS